MIMELACVHHSPSALMKITGYSKSTVYRVYKAWKEEGKVKHKPHKTHIDKKRTPTFLANLNRTIKANPAMNLTTLAKKKKVCRTTIRRSMVDLGLKSYRLTIHHLLMAKMKETRVVRGKRLLSKLPF